MLGISPDSPERLAEYARKKLTPFGFVSDTDRSKSKAYKASDGKHQLSAVKTRVFCDLRVPSSLARGAIKLEALRTASARPWHANRP